MYLTLGYYLLNDDEKGFEKACERLFGKEKKAPLEIHNSNSDGTLVLTSYSDDLEL